MDKVEQRVRFIASVVYINCEKPISDIQETVSPDIAVFIPSSFPSFPVLIQPFSFQLSDKIASLPVSPSRYLANYLPIHTTFRTFAYIHAPKHPEKG